MFKACKTDTGPLPHIFPYSGAIVRHFDICRCSGILGRQVICNSLGSSFAGAGTSLDTLAFAVGKNRRHASRMFMWARSGTSKSQGISVRYTGAHGFRAGLVVWFVWVAASCTFQSTFGQDSRIFCAQNADCPAPYLCLNATSLCVAETNPCVLVDAPQRTVERVPDGTPCESGRICMEGVCIEPRCGDGVVTGSETCDGEPECRDNCTRCGDGVIDEGERCDEGAANSDETPNACRSTCEPSRCGDGVRDVGEGCDLGINNRDNAPSACRTNCALPSCGDGVLDLGESCDHGSANNDTLADACRTTCTPARCGDGVVDEGETCDEGLANSDVQPNSCRSTCEPHRCGDGVRDVGEACDDGFGNSDQAPGACRTSCALPSCGDGIVDRNEECDNGLDNSDTQPGACRTTCVPARCGDGVVDDGEACDDGLANSDVQPNACRERCTFHRCGDGVRDLEEQCDDGSLNSDEAPDSCRRSCALPTCGDGVVDTYETCDDGNEASGDGCRADCAKIESCGDGVRDENEDCDDANLNPADGCNRCQHSVWAREVWVAGKNSTPEYISKFCSAPDGVVYFSDPVGHRIYRLGKDGTFSAVLSNISATNLAADNFGNLYFSENNSIHKIDRDGTLSRIAGEQYWGFSVDGTAATDARLNGVRHLTVDHLGRVFFYDGGNKRIRMIDEDGILRTVAGNGTAGAPLDGSLATQTSILPVEFDLDLDGNLYVFQDEKVRKIDNNGIIQTLFEIPRTHTDLGNSFYVDDTGNVYFSESNNGNTSTNGLKIRQVTPAGGVVHIAGTTASDISGDGGPATEAGLGGADTTQIHIDRHGTIFVLHRAELGEWLVRRIENNEIRTIGVLQAEFRVETKAEWLHTTLPDVHAVDDGLLVSSTRSISGSSGHVGRIYHIDRSGDIRLVVDLGNSTLSPIQEAGSPRGITADSAGNIYISDAANCQVQKFDTHGVLSVIAGTNCVDGPLFFPNQLTIDSAGRLYVVSRNTRSSSGLRISRIEDSGAVEHVAGNGENGFGGDGGPAVLAAVSNSLHIAVDTQDRLLILDEKNLRLRRVNADGTIETIAGTGAQGYATEGGDARAQPLHAAKGLAVDASGDIYISELYRLLSIQPDGTLSILAGVPNRAQQTGDGGEAQNATGLFGTLSVDPRGGIYSESGYRVRHIDAAGTIRAFAGTMHPGGPGPFASARLYPPKALLFTPYGILSAGDQGRLLRIDAASRGVHVVLGYPSAAPEVQDEARYAPFLQNASGIVFDPVAHSLVVTERDSGNLRVVQMDIDGDQVLDEPNVWRNETVYASLLGPSGIAYDTANDDFIIAEQDNHCVSRVSRAGERRTTVAGICGVPGSFDGFLNHPTHVLLSPFSGALYVSDTGNHRVLRIDLDDDHVELVVGDGSISSAGEGEPARLFPVHAPQQLAMDDFGNLYIASSTTVRMIANTDGDDDADGDDVVFTNFGGGERDTFPESNAFCLNALALDDEGALLVADACQGFLVRVKPGAPAAQTASVE